MRVVAFRYYGKARGSVTCAHLFFRSTVYGISTRESQLRGIQQRLPEVQVLTPNDVTVNRHNSGVMTRPPDNSPVLYLSLSEGELCSSAGLNSFRFSIGSQERPTALISEHKR